MCQVGPVLFPFFQLVCGIRQGGVLSPVLFALYVDDLIDKLKLLSYGCFVRFVNFNVLMYADDILLIAPTVNALQLLVTSCELTLKCLDMSINVKKSACMRIGKRANVECSSITIGDGQTIGWHDNLKYLGINFIRATYLKCCTRRAKGAFYRAFNAIFGKVGRCASETVLAELLVTKCLPILLYAVEACPLNTSEINSLQFALSSAIMKIFKTKSKEIAAICADQFGIPDISTSLKNRTDKFIVSFYSIDTVYRRALL
jgi:hypothetical protein